MVFANFDDGFADSPKVEALSDAAFRLHVAGILYSTRLLTDGVIHEARVARLVPRYKPRTLKELLGTVWHGSGHSCADCPQPGPNAVVIHDFLDWNRSKDRVLADRAKAAERQRRVRSQRTAPVSHGVTDGVTHTTHSTPLHSDVTEPPQPPAQRGERSRRRQPDVGPVAAALPTIADVLADRPPVDQDMNLAEVRALRHRTPDPAA